MDGDPPHHGVKVARRNTTESAPDSDAPAAPCRRRGLPIYDPDKVECWRDVAEHCWQLDWVAIEAADEITVDPATGKVDARSLVTVLSHRVKQHLADLGEPEALDLKAP